MQTRRTFRTSTLSALFAGAILSLVSIADAQTPPRFDVTDDSMLDDNWFSFFTSTGNQTQVVGHVASSELGAHGYQSTGVQGFFPPVFYTAYHISLLDAYFPSFEGRVEKFEYEMWNRTTFAGHVWNFIVYQGGSIYRSNMLEDSREAVENGSGFWHHTPFRSAPIDSFYRVFGNGPAGLQDGPTAEPMLVGYMNYNGVGLRDQNFRLTTVGIFDATIFHARITPVPEPASVAALAIGATGLLRRRRKSVR